MLILVLFSALSLTSQLTMQLPSHMFILSRHLIFPHFFLPLFLIQSFLAGAVASRARKRLPKFPGRSHELEVFLLFVVAVLQILTARSSALLVVFLPLLVTEFVVKLIKYPCLYLLVDYGLVEGTVNRGGTLLLLTARLFHNSGRDHVFLGVADERVDETIPALVLLFILLPCQALFPLLFTPLPLQVGFPRAAVH